MRRSARQRRTVGMAAIAVAIAGGVAAGLPLPASPDEIVAELPPQLVGPPVEMAMASAASAPGDGAGDGGRTVVKTLTGSASYYANSLAGRRTASGERYRPQAMVAAHPSLPFGTRLRVENLRNGRSVEVTVIDRGPFARGRILDLSRRAAEELDFIRQGHTRVRIDVLGEAGEAGGAADG